MLVAEGSLTNKDTKETTKHLIHYSKDRKRINSFLNLNPLTNTEKLQAINQDLIFCNVKNWFNGDIDPNLYTLNMINYDWKLFQTVSNDKFTLSLVAAKIFSKTEESEPDYEDWENLR